MSPTTATAATGDQSNRSMDLLDLHAPGHIETTQIEGGGARTLRMVLSGAALLIAGIIGISLLTGANDADTGTESAAATTDADPGDATSDPGSSGPDSDEAESRTPGSAAESETGDQLYPDATSSTSDAGSAGDTADERNAPAKTAADTAFGVRAFGDDPGASEKADEVTEQMPEIVALDLTGYLVNTSNQGVEVLDLATGKLVEDLFPDDLRGAQVTNAGLVCCVPAYTSDSQNFLEWSLFPWDGSGPIELQLDESGQIRGIIDDPDAGTLLLTSKIDDTSPLSFVDGAAVRVDTGERKTIALDESLPLAVPALWQSPNPGDNLRLGSGNAIFEWRWEDGWRQVGTGDLMATAGTHYIADSCTSPASCERNLYATGGGDPIGPLPTDMFLYPSMTSHLSPGGDWLLLDSWANNEPAAELINIESGTRKKFEIDSADFGFGLLAAWVNDDYVVVPGERREFVLLDANSDERWAIPGLTRRNSSGQISNSITWVPSIAALAPVTG